MSEREHLSKQWAAAEGNWRTQRDALLHRNEFLEQKLAEIQQERTRELDRQQMLERQLAAASTKDKADRSAKRSEQSVGIVIRVEH